ncbi:MAG TPA: hypothetical protein VFP34_02705 [Microlunatus sp.]|nr:hypothetical protein [Microlunatus sp.]
MTHTHRDTNFRIALNREWCSIASEQPELPDRWRPMFPGLDPDSSIDDVLRAVRADPDPSLGGLLRLCGGGDLLAGRVVLQAMLGKLVLMARRDPHAPLDDYVSAAWLQIRTYPLDRRPIRIAANLALDTLKVVRRGSAPPRGFEVTPVPPASLEDRRTESPFFEPEDHLGARRVIAAAARLGLITEHTESVLLSVYADGLSGQHAAERHGKSPSAIRTQCSSAVRVLSRHAQTLAEAA